MRFERWTYSYECRGCGSRTTRETTQSVEARSYFVRCIRCCRRMCRTGHAHVLIAQLEVESAPPRRVLR